MICRKRLLRLLIFVSGFALISDAYAYNEVANAVSVCPGTQTVPGMDVSDYQVNGNWGQVKDEGREFAFVKATQGIGVLNYAFASEWPKVKAAGIIRSAYHYFVPSDNPATQAQYFLQTVGKFDAGDLPPMLDLEITNGVAVATVVANALTWLNAVEAATGLVPIIYTNPAFVLELHNPESFAKYPLFVANYEVTCPQVPAPWTSWTFWQQNVGSIPGITGTTDIDVFNGTLDELNAF